MAMEACRSSHLMVQDVPVIVYEYGQYSEYSTSVFLSLGLIEAGHRTLIPNQMTEIFNLSNYTTQ